MGWKKHNIRKQEEADLLGLRAVAMALYLTSFLK